MMFQNRVLRRIFGPQREEVAGGWRRVNNEELHNLYVSSDIITVIKSRRLKWVEHVAQMGDMRKAYKRWSENFKGRGYSEYLSVDRKIILKWILGK
jgi:hypothetical protein